MNLINTFDVEPWWATVPPTFPSSAWDGLNDRSPHAVCDYLDLCGEFKVRCTFFIVGWWAQKHPALVRRMVRDGHELGCHGLYHEDVATLSRAEFLRTTRLAKAWIEEAGDAAVLAYRAPSFSVPKNLNGFFSDLLELGFSIDSSVCTAARIYGGRRSGSQTPVRPEVVFSGELGSLFEVPVPGAHGLTFEPQVFGGGYLRLLPQAALNAIAERQTYQVLYLHPHDFDLNLPSLPGASRLTNLRRRIHVGNTTKKVRALFAAHKVSSVGQISGGRYPEHVVSEAAGWCESADHQALSVPPAS